MIPGTEGVMPGPGVRLDDCELAFAALQELELAGARFDFLNLDNAQFESSNLSDANLAGANLTDANFVLANLTRTNLRGTNLRRANLTLATLSEADLGGAVVTEANFTGATLNGFRREQFYSTASYKARELHGIKLAFNDLSGWDFHDQDLTNASFGVAALVNTNLSGAVVKGADFNRATARGFAKEQLYSTRSYQTSDLAGLWLSNNDLRGWDFSGKSLTNVRLKGSNLAGADLSLADIRGAYPGLDLAEAMVSNSILPDGVMAGLNLAADDQLVVRNYHGDPNQGLGPVSINVHDEVIMESDSELRVLFDSDDWGSTISFQPGIAVTLGGSLELAFADGIAVELQVGRTFDVFDWDGVSSAGGFSVESNHLWDLSQLYTSGEVTLLAALTGDTDADGDVDLADLNNVRNNFGGAGLGDTNIDGTVDLKDLEAVRNSFGVSAQPAVPEPATGLLLPAGYLAIGAWQRARRAIHQRVIVHDLA